MNDVAESASLAGKLSATEKDDLIARLWRDLQAERVRSTELERRLAQDDNSRETGPLLARLQQAAPANGFRGRCVPPDRTGGSPSRNRGRLSSPRRSSWLLSRSISQSVSTSNTGWDKSDWPRSG